MTLPRSWALLVAELNGHPLVGTPGIRDIAAPCDHFDSDHPTVAGLGLRWVSKRTSFGTCDTDGHYLCVECSHMSRDQAEQRGLTEPE